MTTISHDLSKIPCGYCSTIGLILDRREGIITINGVPDAIWFQLRCPGCGVAGPASSSPDEAVDHHEELRRQMREGGEA